MSDSGELSGGEVRAPSVPASSPAPAPTPFARDGANYAAGREQIERGRSEAAQTRAAARGETTQQPGGAWPT